MKYSRMGYVCFVIGSHVSEMLKYLHPENRGSYEIQ